MNILKKPVKFLIRLFFGDNGWEVAKRTILATKIRIMKLIYSPDPKARRLNLGGGNWYLPYWEVVDWYASAPYTDYKMDFRNKTPLPFSDKSVQFIFTSHTLEHIADDEVLFLLKESYRVLKPYGVLRISVPDGAKAIESYRNHDKSFFYSGQIGLTGDSLERRLVNVFASFDKGEYKGGPIVDPKLVRKKLSALHKYDFIKWCVSLIPKDITYQGHVNGYDFVRMKDFLQKVGFTKIERSGYRQSSVPEMGRKEFDNRPLVSLFVEAVKIE